MKRAILSLVALFTFLSSGTVLALPELPLHVCPDEQIEGGWVKDGKQYWLHGPEDADWVNAHCPNIMKNVAGKTAPDPRKEFARVSLKLRLPFNTVQDAPIAMNPLGYARSSDPNGHGGFDFYWKKNVPIIAPHRGSVVYLRKARNDTEWNVVIRNGKYFSFFAHLKSVAPKLRVGSRMNAGAVIGTSFDAPVGGSEPDRPGVHWTFGYYYQNLYATADGNFEFWEGARCPLHFLTAKDKSYLTALHKSEAQVLCQGYYPDW